MAIETNLSLIFWDTIAGILKNLPMFILIVWGVKVISREIKIGIKNVPNWLEQYDKMKLKHYAVEGAIGKR